jgi:hypothetical protein
VADRRGGVTGAAEDEHQGGRGLAGEQARAAVAGGGAQGGGVEVRR